MSSLTQSGAQARYLRDLSAARHNPLRSRAAILLLATIIMLIILRIVDPPFVTLSSLKVVGLQVTEAGIVAVGMTLLMISGNVDLSVGSMTGLIAVASALLSLSVPEPWPLLIGVAIGATCGLFNGYFVWRVKLSPLIVTIGSLSLMYGLGLVLNSGQPVDTTPASFSTFGSVNIFGFSIAFAFFIVLSILAGLYLTFAQTGRHLYAIGGNSEAAARVGINVKRLVIWMFGINGLITGLGAVLLASRFADGDPSFGLNLEIQVITAVILGGVAFDGGEGGMGGVFMAVVFLQVLESGIVAAGISPYWSDVVEGGALIAAVVIQQLTKEQHARRQRAAALADLIPTEVEPAATERGGATVTHG